MTQNTFQHKVTDKFILIVIIVIVIMLLDKTLKSNVRDTSNKERKMNAKMGCEKIRG